MDIQGPNYTSGKLIFSVNLVPSVSFCNKRKAKKRLTLGTRLLLSFKTDLEAPKPQNYDFPNDRRNDTFYRFDVF